MVIVNISFLLIVKKIKKIFVQIVEEHAQQGAYYHLGRDCVRGLVEHVAHAVTASRQERPATWTLVLVMPI